MAQNLPADSGSGGGAGARPGGAPDEVGDASLDVDDIVADFDKATFVLQEQRYGVLGLLGLRDAMLPIAKPHEIATLKYLKWQADQDQEREDARRERKDQQRRSRDDREGKGAGKGKGQKGAYGWGGRVVPQMGRTEISPGPQPGQWWKNLEAHTLDVIVREQFSLDSKEVRKVSSGHYLQQAGPLEVFVEGPAKGLSRMPVHPSGWVTVDASLVGGPQYLEPVKEPRWQVVFTSGTGKGDVVVRAGLSLDTDEVAHLWKGSEVLQSGPSSIIDGIVRMPITFMHNGSGPRTSGYVTCDASGQGGPQFFVPSRNPPAGLAEASAPAQSSNAEAADPGEDVVDKPSTAKESGERENTWDKNRTWKVISLGDPDSGRMLPLTNKAEPFAPGSGRVPPDDMLVRWLHDGDIVEQVGHSKKMRGFMVMPVRLVGGDEEKDVGFVTRRMVDKSRDGTDEAWFVELRNGVEANRESRRPRRSRGGQDE